VPPNIDVVNPPRIVVAARQDESLIESNYVTDRPGNDPPLLLAVSRMVRGLTGGRSRCFEEGARRPSTLPTDNE